MQPPWVTEGDGYRCKPHGEFFKAPNSCSKCVDDHGEPFDAEVDAPLAAAPKGCESSLDHERELTAIAKFADARARELSQGKPAVRAGKGRKRQAAVEAQPALAVKMLDLAVKARRAAASAAVRREDEDTVRARERRQRARDRGGRGASN